MSRLLTAFLLGAAACAPVDPLWPIDRTPVEYEIVSRFPACDAAEPLVGRFVDSALERGLDRMLDPPPTGDFYHGPQTGVIADDIDNDGDIDLLFWDGIQTLRIHWNNGQGDFRTGQLPPPPALAPQHHLRVASAGDIDGDGRLDLVWAGDGVALWSIQAGGQAFSPWQIALAEEGSVLGGYASAAFGDIDSDGDLDVVLAGLDQRPVDGSLPDTADGWTPSADRVLFNDSGTLTAGPELVQADGATMSLIQTFTDRDLDGDTDLLSWADRADAIEGCPGAAFWRNDDGVLINDAIALSADTRASAMGLGSADLNRDGLLDYCVTDIADKLTCLVSDGQGAYYEGASAMGLTVDRSRHPGSTPPGDTWDIFVGWGLVMVDLDNDGLEDAAATGSVISTRLDLTRPDVDTFQPHWLWRGTAPGQFETDLTTGFEQSTRWAWGLVSADLDGDGARELISAPASGLPEIWDNPCTEGASLEVEPIMAGPNRHAVGATVTVTAAGNTWTQQVGSTAAGGQSPGRLHFGLGTGVETATVEILWPGGRRTVVEGVPTNSHVRIRP